MTTWTDRYLKSSAEGGMLWMGLTTPQSMQG
jgi:hypothetical protein